MRWVDRSFAGQPHSVGQARRFVQEVAAQWSVDPDGMPLVVSELATNAVVHAHSDYSVRLCQRGTELRVDVEDRDPTLPHPTQTALADQHGRGLALVELFASRWGTDALPDGKVVWALLPVGGPASAGPGVTGPGVTGPGVTGPGLPSRWNW